MPGSRRRSPLLRLRRCFRPLLPSSAKPVLSNEHRCRSPRFLLSPLLSPLPSSLFSPSISLSRASSSSRLALLALLSRFASSSISSKLLLAQAVHKLLSTSNLEVNGTKSGRREESTSRVTCRAALWRPEWRRRWLEGGCKLTRRRGRKWRSARTGSGTSRVVRSHAIKEKSRLPQRSRLTSARILRSSVKSPSRLKCQFKGSRHRRSSAPIKSAGER